MQEAGYSCCGGEGLGHAPVPMLRGSGVWPPERARPTCCTPSANDHPPKADTDVKCTALCPLTCVKMHQSAAPDSPCTVCSDYTPQGAQLGTYQQPWSRFAICAPTAARAVQNERVHPQPSRGRFVPASSLSPFFRPTKERFPPL